MRAILADLLCCMRILLAPAFWIALRSSLPALPFLVLSAAALSDYVDGRIARRVGSVSRRGAWLDVIADGFFVVVSLVAAALQGWVSFFLPFTITLALAALARQWILVPPGAQQRRGRADRFGHAAGVANYAAVLLVAGVPLGWVPIPFCYAASWPIALLNLTPIFLRLRRAS